MPKFASASADDGYAPFRASSHTLLHSSSARDLTLLKAALSKTGTQRNRKHHKTRTTASECSAAVSRDGQVATPFSGPRKLRYKFPTSTDSGPIPARDPEHISPRCDYSALAYPSPPPSPLSVSESLFQSLPPLLLSKNIHDAPFPLNPAELSPISLGDLGEIAPRTPRRRHISADSRLAKSSPDRFIPVRRKSQDLGKTYRLSKSPERLTPQERLFRHHSSSPNPFGSLRPPRMRNQRQGLLIDESPSPVNSGRSRTIGSTNVTALPQEPLSSQNRQISAGAVWNVGGGVNIQTPFSGPIRAVSNGRGGFLSSGSNAPMFASQFLDDLPPDQNMEGIESRLSAALDIDQASRVLNFAPCEVQPRSVTTGSIGLKRKSPYIEPRTVWKEGAWVNEGSPQCKHSSPFEHMMLYIFPSISTKGR